MTRPLRGRIQVLIDDRTCYVGPKVAHDRYFGTTDWAFEGQIVKLQKVGPLYRMLLEVYQTS